MLKRRNNPNVRYLTIPAVLCALLCALSLITSAARTGVTPLDLDNDPADSGEVSTEQPPQSETEPPKTVESISFSQREYVLKVGESEQTVVVALPEDAEGFTLVYSSSDNSVFTVSADGVIRARADGKGIITAAVQGNEAVFCEASVTVTSSDLKIFEDSATGESYIKGINPGTSVSSVKTSMALLRGVEESAVSVSAYDSSAVSDDAKAGTGMIISCEGINYNIVIYGDVDGSGTITYADTRMLISLISGTASYTTQAQRKAADINGGENPDIECALRISRHVNKNQTISQN